MKIRLLLLAVFMCGSGGAFASDQQGVVAQINDPLFKMVDSLKAKLHKNYEILAVFNRNSEDGQFSALLQDTTLRSGDNCFLVILSAQIQKDTQKFTSDAVCSRGRNGLEAINGVNGLDENRNKFPILNR